uniref:Uncharacterized protein n=1 Tax=Trichuris muris TaxID=70415 RepID=A0A5S6Q781_TRIMR
MATTLPTAAKWNRSHIAAVAAYRYLTQRCTGRVVATRRRRVFGLTHRIRRWDLLATTCCAFSCFGKKLPADSANQGAQGPLEAGRLAPAGCTVPAQSQMAKRATAGTRSTGYSGSDLRRGRSESVGAGGPFPSGPSVAAALNVSWGSEKMYGRITCEGSPWKGSTPRVRPNGTLAPLRAHRLTDKREGSHVGRFGKSTTCS